MIVYVCMCDTYMYIYLCVLHVADSETAKAFESHFEMQINLYSEQVLVNLINQSGRERVSMV